MVQLNVTVAQGASAAKGDSLFLPQCATRIEECEGLLTLNVRTLTVTALVNVTGVPYQGWTTYGFAFDSSKPLLWSVIDTASNRGAPALHQLNPSSGALTPKAVWQSVAWSPAIIAVDSKLVVLAFVDITFTPTFMTFNISTGKVTKNQMLDKGMSCLTRKNITVVSPDYHYFVALRGE
jgi:hypothetical protein